MTYPKLSRLISSISDQELISALRSPSKIPIEELDHQIDFLALDEKVDEISKNNERYFVGTVPINFSFAESKGYKLGDIVRVKAVKLPSSRVKEENKWKVLSLYNKG